MHVAKRVRVLYEECTLSSRAVGSKRAESGDEAVVSRRVSSSSTIGLNCITRRTF